MNGSAVALGTLLAATAAKLPVKIDCWLAIAQNHISAKAYKQNDVIKSLNGTTIEIVHTDAEGRMGTGRYSDAGFKAEAGVDHGLRHAYRQHGSGAGSPLQRDTW